MGVKMAGVLVGWSGLLLALATVGTSQPGAESVPSNLGNRHAILAQLEALGSDRPVSFAVVGDSHGSATFNGILETLKGKKLDFIVHLGDFAAAPSPDGHALFLEQVRRGLGPNGPPMLVVMGNHDVGPSFQVEAFERLYGPSSYSFRCGGNLFVVVRNCLPRSLRNGHEEGAWQEWVAGTIQEKGYGARRTFVLMHAPPVDPLAPLEQLRAERFQRHWSGLGIDYFIAGHLHEYGRTEIGATVVLVSGGGGGTLRRVRSGRFHHAVIFRVAGDQLTEELIVVEKPWAPFWGLQRAATRGLFPVLSLLRAHLPFQVWAEAGKGSDGSLRDSSTTWE